MQELLRHSSLRSTLDVYTQAVSPAKHAAQAAVVSLVFSHEAAAARSRLLTPRRDEALRREKCVKKGHEKGHENAPFWVLNGLSEIETTLLE